MEVPRAPQGCHLLMRNLLPDALLSQWQQIHSFKRHLMSSTALRRC